MAPTRSAKPVLHRSVPSLIKWTGSKRSQARTIKECLPDYRRYFEPFLGSGAVLFLAAVPGSLAGDIYPPLVKLWQLVQSDPVALVNNYEAQWQRLQEELNLMDAAATPRGAGLPKYYYQVRERFNATGDPCDLNFLVRTCVNGIVRFNRAGEFNNSFHLSRKGMTPARFGSVVAAWHKVLRDVEFVCQDYAVTVAAAERGDFVYLDPPYAGNRQRYISDLDLERFFNVLNSLNRRRVHWALSFDGHRGNANLEYDVPRSLYCRRRLVSSGNSAVHKVLNGPVERVVESLYLNY